MHGITYEQLGIEQQWAPKANDLIRVAYCGRCKLLLREYSNF